MKCTSEMANKLKVRMAEAFSGILIREADAAVAHTKLVTLSEPKFPVELLKENAE